jgi:PAS domain-containing protein
MANTSLTYPALGGQSIPKSLFLEGILDILPIFVFWKNAESVYLGCSLNFAELVGLEESDRILGKTDIELPWRNAEGNPIDELARWDDDVFNDQLVINRHLALPLSFGTRTVSLTKLPLLNEDGKVIGLVGFFKGFGDGLL